MKHFHLFLWMPWVVLALASCESKAVSTPGLQVSSYIIRTSAAGVRDTVSVYDTLQIGDTALMGLAAYGRYNYLTGIRAQADTTCLRLGFLWNHDDDKYIIQGSDPEHGILLFVPEQINSCVTTLRYISIKAGTHRVEVTVSSDAGSGYSPRMYYFNVVARDSVASPL